MVGITLEDQIFVERGEVASHREQPPIESNVFRARVFWLGRAPLEPGNRYTLKLNTSETDVTVQSIESVIDTGDLSARPAELLERNGVAEVVLRTRGLLALDEHRANPLTGRFVLVEDHLPVGGGIISMEGYPDQRELITRRATNITMVGHGVAREARHARNGHKGGVLWFTGLSGSGKSTLALALEARLFAKGYHVRARRRQHPRRPERQPRVLARGPRREHPACWRGRGVVRGRRLPGHHLVHLAVSGGPRARAPRRARGVPRNLHRRAARGVRGA